MSKIIEVSKKGKQAISVSIRKWERVVKAWEKCGPDDTPDPGHDGIGWVGCGLCTQYRLDNARWYIFCEGCPISLDTGWPGCQGTPYDRYETGGEWDYNKEGAQDELNCLRNLDSRCVVVPGLRHNRVKA